MLIDVRRVLAAWTHHGCSPLGCAAQGSFECEVPDDQCRDGGESTTHEHRTTHERPQTADACKTDNRQSLEVGSRGLPGYTGTARRENNPHQKTDKVYFPKLWEVINLAGHALRRCRLLVRARHTQTRK